MVCVFLRISDLGFRELGFVTVQSGFGYFLWGGGGGATEGKSGNGGLRNFQDYGTWVFRVRGV